MARTKIALLQDVRKDRKTPNATSNASNASNSNASNSNNAATKKREHNVLTKSHKHKRRRRQSTATATARHNKNRKKKTRKSRRHRRRRDEEEAQDHDEPAHDPALQAALDAMDRLTAPAGLTQHGRPEALSTGPVPMDSAALGALGDPIVDLCDSDDDGASLPPPPPPPPSSPAPAPAPTPTPMDQEQDQEENSEEDPLDDLPLPVSASVQLDADDAAQQEPQQPVSASVSVSAGGRQPLDHCPGLEVVRRLLPLEEVRQATLHLDRFAHAGGCFPESRRSAVRSNMLVTLPFDEVQVRGMLRGHDDEEKMRRRAHADWRVPLDLDHRVEQPMSLAFRFHLLPGSPSLAHSSPEGPGGAVARAVAKLLESRAEAGEFEPLPHAALLRRYARPEDRLDWQSDDWDAHARWRDRPAVLVRLGGARRRLEVRRKDDRGDTGEDGAVWHGWLEPGDAVVLRRGFHGDYELRVPREDNPGGEVGRAYARHELGAEEKARRQKEAAGAAGVPGRPPFNACYEYVLRYQADRQQEPHPQR